MIGEYLHNRQKANDPVNVALHRELAERVRAAFAEEAERRPRRWIRVVKLAYGLEDGLPYSYSEIERITKYPPRSRVLDGCERTPSLSAIHRLRTVERRMGRLPLIVSNY